MSKRPADLLIEDMWEAINKVETYTQGMSGDDFFEDDLSADAVVRNLEIIGEVANRIPVEFKSEHPEVQWDKIAGLRHRIVHDYFGIDLGIIWQIIKNDLPPLKKKIGNIRKKAV